MIVYGSGRCGAPIVWAWARTGQTEPIGFHLDGDDGAGYAVNGAGGMTELSVQIHYQHVANGAAPQRDRSGVQLTLDEMAPRLPLRVTLLQTAFINIPAGRPMVECMRCRVHSEGTVVGFRNHAHRLARDIWSEVHAPDGRVLSPLGNVSATKAQIFRRLDAPRVLTAGSTLLLQCAYDGTRSSSDVGFGLDERAGEMCNQYLLASSSLGLSCASDPPAQFLSTHGGPAASEQRQPALQPATEQASEGGATVPGAALSPPLSPPLSPLLGQVAGVALARDGRSVWLVHRGANEFGSAGLMAAEALVQLNRTDGTPLSASAPATFVVPHGLSADPTTDDLWVTDVGAHTVVRYDVRRGKVVLTLGTHGVAGCSATNFNKPTDVAVSARRREVFISDGYGNARVAVFALADGAFLREWGSAGRGPSQFRIPHSLTIDDARGVVYVADRENSRLQKFRASDGRYLDQFVSHVAPSVGRGPVWSHHVSSVHYSAPLDALVVVEGGSALVRSPSGCVLSGTTGHYADWPHDAVLFPRAPVAANAAPPAATANASVPGEESAAPCAPLLSNHPGGYELWMAELQGKRVARFVGASGGEWHPFDSVGSYGVSEYGSFEYGANSRGADGASEGLPLALVVVGVIAIAVLFVLCLMAVLLDGRAGHRTGSGERRHATVSMAEGGHVGCTLENAEDDDAADEDGGGGVRVVSVTAGDYLWQAGLEAGDVILSIDGVRVQAHTHAIEALESARGKRRGRVEIAYVRYAERGLAPALDDGLVPAKDGAVPTEEASTPGMRTSV